MTDTPASQWAEADGPDSGSGTDRWLQNKVTGQVLYAHCDEGEWDFQMQSEE